MANKSSKKVPNAKETGYDSLIKTRDLHVANKQTLKQDQPGVCKHISASNSVFYLEPIEKHKIHRNLRVGEGTQKFSTDVVRDSDGVRSLRNGFRKLVGLIEGGQYLVALASKWLAISLGDSHVVHYSGSGAEKDGARQFYVSRAISNGCHIKFFGCRMMLVETRQPKKTEC
ncbi:hypothetical protein R1sor_002930 [Riccia sorocarpa]|uniref:Uncharacterized protein n=1 Tax=Riccia sorocarpa TaxID=122646 RepID=A0ABD3H0Z7_9MARC